MRNLKNKLAGAAALVAAVSTLGYSAPAAAQDGREKFIDPATVAAAEGNESLSISSRVGFYSDYVWRGINLYKGVSIQPSAGVFYDTGELGTVGASLWMHIPGDNEQGALNDKFYELDGTLSYDYTYDVATFSVGHIWYTDPGYDSKREIDGVEVEVGEIAPDTSEVYFGVSLDLPGQPQFTFYDDYRTLEYQYYSLSFSHPFKPKTTLGEGFNVTPFVTFGFASSADDDKLVYTHDGLVHANVGVSSNLPLGVLNVHPSFVYNIAADGDKDINIGGQDFSLESRTVNKFYFGVDISYDFGI